MSDLIQNIYVCICATAHVYLRVLIQVHRLDKPTSGLLLIAKTKPAMVHLTRQFTNRIIKKTYTAIVNGIPSEPLLSNISNENARKLGFDVNADENVEWQVIDNVMDEKNAVTIWRTMKSVKSLKANDGALTLVELKPKTGRYHQLRVSSSYSSYSIMKSLRKCLTVFH